MSIGIHDEVRIISSGEIGCVTRDRCNGMIDVTLNHPNHPPVFEQVGRRMYLDCAGTRSCLYKDEVELIRKQPCTCVHCK